MLLRWLNILAGMGHSGTIETVHRIRVHSWLPGWLVPFLLVFFEGLCIFQYRRRRGLSRTQFVILVALRSLAYAMLLLLIARPELKAECEGVLTGPVPVVVDGSQSMEIRDCGSLDRAGAAVKLATGLAAKQDEYPALRLTSYWAGKTFGPLDASGKLVPDAASTSINRMLEGGMRDHVGTYCPGVVLLTDGAHNTTELVDHVLPRFTKARIPVYTVGFGEERSRDLATTLVLAEDVVFKDEKAKIYVNLTQRGYAGQQAMLSLYLGERRVTEVPVEFGEEQELSVPVEYIPEETGEFQLRAEIEQLGDEITFDNNMFVKNLRVIDEHIKVLLLFGSPTWEYRYLKGAFERDNRVEFKVFLQSLDRRVLRHGNAGEYVTKLPGTAEVLNDEYDLVVLSAVNALDFAPAFREALAGFVRDHAGGLVILSDSRYIPYSLKGTELEPLVPVTLGSATGRTYRDELFDAEKEAFAFVITEEGHASPLVAFSGNREENQEIWGNFPPLYDCYTEGRLKPASVNLLASFENRYRQKYPAIVHHSFGKGVALFMAFDSTWRWRREFGDRYFREFWGKVVQFLGLPHLLGEAAQTTLYVSKENCFIGERVSITAKLTNPDFSPYISERVPLSIKQGEETHELDLVPIPERLGVYRANFWPEQEGDVTFLLAPEFAAKPISLRVVPQRKEFLESGMNRVLLEQVSEATGGRFFAGGETTPEALLDTVLEGRARVDMDITKGVWETWLALLLCMLFLSLEWLCRKLFYLD